MSTGVLALHEWRRQFGSGFGWFCLAALFVLLAWDFFARIDQWLILQEQELAPAALTEAIAVPLLAQAAQLLLALAVVLSLRGFCDERRLGTDELWLAAPIGARQIVLGKFFGLLPLALLVIAYAVTLALLLGLGGDPDSGRILAAALGLTLLAGVALAAAVAMAAICRSSLAAALSSAAVLLAWFLLDYAPRARGVGDSWLSWFSLAAHLRPFLAGRIALSALLCMAVFILAWLLIAALWTRPGRPWPGTLVAAALALVAVSVGARATHYWDWTANRRHSLSGPTLEVLAGMEQPLEVTVYASLDPRLRHSLRGFLLPYQRASADLSVRFVDPASAPQLMREKDIRGNGELRLGYAGREAALRNLSEADFLGALMRLTRPRDSHVAYSFGSGERDLRGAANFDLGRFGDALAARGIIPQPLDLMLHPAVPDNLDLLIITEPRTPLLPGIGTALAAHVAAGGNVLWLTDPGEDLGMEPLLQALSLRILPGSLVDARAGDLGIDDPRNVMVRAYPPHPVTRDFSMATIFFGVSALEAAADSSWHSEPIVASGGNTWNESGPIIGQISIDEDQGERRGPLAAALALTREHPRGEQRAVVFGDADFLSNQFLGNGGNLDLGLKVVEWLLADERGIALPARLTVDRRLELTDARLAGLAGIFLVAIPGLLLAVGFGLAWRWRRA